MSMGNWWSKRWEALLTELGIVKPDSAASRAYRVKRLEVIPGGIAASIHDRDAGACQVEIRLDTLRDEQWEHVYDQMAAQPLVTTQLVTGAMPPDLEQIFVDAGARLFPVANEEIRVECSCCTRGPCRHLPLVYSLFAEMLADDPGLLFTLRGRDRQRVLRDVREGRGHQPSGTVSTGTENSELSRDTLENEQASPLIADLDQYWGNRRLLKQFHHHIAPPTVELSLLRRLGPMTASDEAMGLYEQMVALYRRITEEALALAYSSGDENGDVRNGGPLSPNGDVGR